MTRITQLAVTFSLALAGPTIAAIADTPLLCWRRAERLHLYPAPGAFVPPCRERKSG